MLSLLFIFACFNRVPLLHLAKSIYLSAPEYSQKAVCVLAQRLG